MKKKGDQLARALPGVVQILIEQGLIVPLALGGREEEAWADCDLVSLAENRASGRWDPFALDEGTRRDLVARVMTQPPCPPGRRDYEACHWLHRDGERVGTVALGTPTRGLTHLGVSSLYVLPEHRGRGVASGLLRTLRDALGQHNRGLRLHTSWLWPTAVDLYRHLGLWVRTWKRQLTFEWSLGEPEPHTSVGTHAARLWVEHRGREIVLATAERRGERLVMDDPTRGIGDAALARARENAAPTLLLALARNGWPLIRSAQHWEAQLWADAGLPESLAYQITVWEAEARQRGWRVETPIIPGLSYPTWAELEARWTTERAAFEEKLRLPSAP